MYGRRCVHVSRKEKGRRSIGLRYKSSTHWQGFGEKFRLLFVVFATVSQSCRNVSTHLSVLRTQPPSPHLPHRVYDCARSHTLTEKMDFCSTKSRSCSTLSPRKTSTAANSRNTNDRRKSKTPKPNNRRPLLK